MNSPSTEPSHAEKLAFLDAMHPQQGAGLNVPMMTGGSLIVPQLMGGGLLVPHLMGGGLLPHHLVGHLHPHMQLAGQQHLLGGAGGLDQRALTRQEILAHNLSRPEM